MSIVSIRKAIRRYEDTTDPQTRITAAAVVRSIGRNFPETAAWLEAFEISVAYNAEQESAASAWLEELREEQRSALPDQVVLCNQRREAMRIAIIGAFNSRTFDELEAMTPAERFADGIVPKWLRPSWSDGEEAGGVPARLDRERA
jgi:hypothetical protein